MVDLRDHSHYQCNYCIWNGSDLAAPSRPGGTQLDGFHADRVGDLVLRICDDHTFATLEGKTFWLKIENIGILSVPVHWFFFSLKYARLDAWLTRKPSQLLFWIIPSFSFALLLSGEWFNLYYSSVQMASETGGPLVISRGPACIGSLLHKHMY
jgi:hypothetical protein